jgi:hypothetical protein
MAILMGSVVYLVTAPGAASIGCAPIGYAESSQEAASIAGRARHRIFFIADLLGWGKQCNV